MISIDPQFVTVANAPFHLASGSPAIDTGDSSAPSLPSVDLASSPRIQGTAIDMGVYEGAVAASGNPSPDFTLSSVPQTLSITAGQSAATTLTLSPVSGAIGTVSFSCSGLPSTDSCSFSPVALAMGGDNAVLATVLTVYDSSAASGKVKPIRVRGTELWLAHATLVSGGLLACVLLIPVSRSAVDHHRANKSMRLVMLIAMMTSVGAVSCGGGSGQGVPPPPPPKTNSYTMTVAATAIGNVGRTHSVNVPVVINH